MFSFIRSEVPHDQYDNLRTRLLQKIMELCSGDKIITTRLCVSVSVLNYRHQHMLQRASITHVINSLDLLHGQLFFFLILHMTFSLFCYSWRP